MAITLCDTRQLSDETLEAFRLRALHGIEQGFTEADVADMLGVARETVSPLVDGLRRARPGRPARRSDRPSRRLGPDAL